MYHKLLFICSANLQRSPTAEVIFKDKYITKSAGIDINSPVRLSRELLVWADIVFVMEDWHLDEIKKRYPDIHKRIICLNIPDRYFKMDKELIRLLREKVKEYLD